MAKRTKTTTYGDELRAELENMTKRATRAEQAAAELGGALQRAKSEATRLQVQLTQQRIKTDEERGRAERAEQRVRQLENAAAGDSLRDRLKRGRA